MQESMNKTVVISFLWGMLVLPAVSSAQQIQYDTLHEGRVIVEKDARVDLLNRKISEHNEALSRKTRTEKGYRLMLLSTTDREKATRLRARLLQLYPDQKLYTLFKSPYIKVKFGNFLDREEAERMKEEIEKKGLVDGNIYLVPEKIEVKDRKEAAETGGTDN